MMPNNIDLRTVVLFMVIQFLSCKRHNDGDQILPYYGPISFMLQPSYIQISGRILALGIAMLVASSITEAKTPNSKPATIRFATFNTSMNRREAGQLANDLAHGRDPQIQKVAAILQHVRPDVVLLNEFDSPWISRSADHFQNNYLSQPQFGNEPINYAYRYFATVNTGEPSGLDFNGDGKVQGPQDAFGFGFFPGQYGMLVLSKYPILTSQIQTFQNFKWSDMPDAMKPTLPDSGKSYYSDDAWSQLRLSSKSHWIVPIGIGKSAIKFITSHPTPPVFDGPDDHNGCRNHDEIRLVRDMLDPKLGGYLRDDAMRPLPRKKMKYFVIAGDLNADPNDGDSTGNPVDMLLSHPLVQDPLPESAGADEAATTQAGKNKDHVGSSKFDTGDFNDSAVGNLRIDYVLPSISLQVIKSGVFWPKQGAIGHDWMDASDHRLVWVDVKAP